MEGSCLEGESRGRGGRGEFRDEGRVVVQGEFVGCSGNERAQKKEKQVSINEAGWSFKRSMEKGRPNQATHPSSTPTPSSPPRSASPPPISTASSQRRSWVRSSFHGKGSRLDRWDRSTETRSEGKEVSSRFDASCETKRKTTHVPRLQVIPDASTAERVTTRNDRRSSDGEILTDGAFEVLLGEERSSFLSLSFLLGRRRGRVGSLAVGSLVGEEEMFIDGGVGGFGFGLEES